MSHKKPLGSNLKLVLMSMIMYPNIAPTAKIDLDKLVPKFKLTKTIVGIKYGKNIKKGQVKKNKQGFYNCIEFTIQLKEGRRASTKLYNDLVVHVAGLRGKHEGYLAANILYNKLLKHGLIPEIPIDLSPNPDATKIILMNSGYNSNMLIDRAKLAKICSEKYKYTTFFLPNSYSGVKLYPAGDLAILIFRTGKIIVTGSKTMNELIDGYYLIENILREHYNEVISKN